jgi:hypothetical protein
MATVLIRGRGVAMINGLDWLISLGARASEGILGKGIAEWQILLYIIIIKIILLIIRVIKIKF